jgi:hypothetical protein
MEDRAGIFHLTAIINHITLDESLLHKKRFDRM